MLSAEPIPAFADNYLWLLSADSSGERSPDRFGLGAAIVDPGDAAPVLRALREYGAELKTILVTHHHADHVGGIGRLLTEFPDARVYAPDDRRIPGVSDVVKEGDVVYVDCLQCDFTVIEVPGHTRSHIAYYGDGKLFCGDTVFACGCGRLFEGTPEQMHASLSKVLTLPDATRIYCAHEYTLDNVAFAKWVEPDNQDLLSRERHERAKRRRGQPTVPSLLSVEKRTNPFLRFNEPTVVRAAEQFAGRKLDDPAEVFGTVRHWKDTEFD